MILCRSYNNRVMDMANVLLASGTSMRWTVGHKFLHLREETARTVITGEAKGGVTMKAVMIVATFIAASC